MPSMLNGAHKHAVTPRAGPIEVSFFGSVREPVEYEFIQVEMKVGGLWSVEVEMRNGEVGVKDGEA